jgi:transcriptional regulator with XRE-family HTH domain
MQALSFIDRQRRVGFPEPVKNRVSQQLHFLLEQRGLTQTDAARMCGMSVARFHNYYTGYRTPDLDTVMRMARALGTSTDYLMGFNGETADVAEVVRRLLELEGMEATRAEVVAETCEEALRLLLVLPDEGDVRTRSRIAAHAAWQIRGGPKPLQ